MKFLITLILLVTIYLPAQADDGDFVTIQNFSNELTQKNYAQAKQYITPESESLFNKYTSYNLGDLTPGNLKLLSQSKTTNFRYLKVSGTDSQGRAGAVNVALVTIQNQPKIDLNETMRLGFGNDWQQKVNMMEQSYLFARKNFGEAQSKQLLITLLQKQRP